MEAAEAEEASYPEGDILGGRIKGPAIEGHHHHLHHHPHHHHGHPHLHADVSNISTVSDLTDSAGKSGGKLDKSEKKGRFIIRELPEGTPPEVRYIY